MSLLKAINDGEKLSPYRLLMMAAWIAYPIMYYINIYTSKMTILGIKGDFIVPLLYISLVVSSFRDIKHRINPWGFFIYIAFLVVYIMTYAFYPQNEQYLNKEFSLFFFVVLPYVFVGLLIDINRFNNSFTFLSIVSVATHVLYQFWYMQTVVARTGLVEDMVGAYMILPHTLFLLWMAIKTKQTITIFAAAFSMLFLTALGNRGSFVCLAVFILLYFFFSGRFKHATLIRTLVLIIGIIVIVFSLQIATYLSNLFLDIGMSNRVFDTIINEEFLISQGRDNIRRIIMESVYNGPILGYGLCGDRTITGGTYAHNFFVEILADFGLLFGPIFILLFVLICAYAFLSCESKDEKAFFSLLIANFTGLMLSGSFIEDYSWAFLFGFSIRKIAQKKSAKKVVTSSLAHNVLVRLR